MRQCVRENSVSCCICASVFLTGAFFFVGFKNVRTFASSFERESRVLVGFDPRQWLDDVS